MFEGSSTFPQQLAVGSQNADEYMRKLVLAREFSITGVMHEVVLHDHHAGRSSLRPLLAAS